MSVFILIVLLVGIVWLLVKWSTRSTKKTLESNRIFRPYDDHIHERPEQQERIKRSLKENMEIKFIAPNKYAGEVIGMTGNVYTVSLECCSCPDFKDRRKPCKHMYYFARKSGRCSIEKTGEKYQIKRI